MCRFSLKLGPLARPRSKTNLKTFYVRPFKSYKVWFFPPLNGSMNWYPHEGISKTRLSQGLLCKHCCNLFINYLNLFLNAVAKAKRLELGQTKSDRTNTNSNTKLKSIKDVPEKFVFFPPSETSICLIKVIGKWSLDTNERCITMDIKKKHSFNFSTL